MMLIRMHVGGRAVVRPSIMVREELLKAGLVSVLAGKFRRNALRWIFAFSPKGSGNLGDV